MNISDEITQRLGLKMVNEYVTEGPWKMWDQGSAEVECLEFFYALVRMMKPEHILETGSHVGLSGAYIALGLRDNARGHLDSIEWTESYMDQAKEKWAKLELDDFITPHSMSSLEFKPKEQYDLVFLDTEPQTRFKELDYYWNDIKPGGIIILHDLHSEMGISSGVWHNRELIEPKIKNHQLTVVPFYTPRGLTLMRKSNDTQERPDYVYRLLTDSI